jgi:arabinogalactan endo-1,4-beta-galactosidase
MRLTPAFRRRWGVLRTAVPVICAAALAAAAALPVAASAGDEGRHESSSALTVDLALGGSATASSAQAAAPATTVNDGSASTSWCPTTGTASVVVDLGRERQLDGVGFTLPTTDSPATVSIALAGRSQRWETVGGSTSAVPTGTAVYMRLRWETSARFARLGVSSADGSPVCVGAFRLFGRDDAASQMSLGGDLTFEQLEYSAGNHFTDINGQQATATQILRAHGGNFVRLRLWTVPPPGYPDLPYDLAAARAVKAAGMKIYLDIHYSDFWADPQHQVTPAAWQGQDLPTLVSTVRSYTRQVIAAFAAQGTPVDMVSIGNEIRNGMLWPLGQIDWTNNTGWANLGMLLKAGVQGARAGNPEDHRLQIMLHWDQGGDNAWSRQFFDNITAQGVPFDVIGLSYYPFWHGTLVALRANVDDLAVRYDKDIVVAEHQYAWTLANGDTTDDFVWTPSQLFAGYPASPGGQLSMASDILSILANIPDGHAGGFFYWEPEWIPGVGWTPGAGTPNDNLTLYDFQGRALPSIGMFQSPPDVCAHFNPSSVLCAL